MALGRARGSLALFGVLRVERTSATQGGRKSRAAGPSAASGAAKTRARASHRESASARGHDLERSQIRENHASSQGSKNAATRGHVASRYGPLCARMENPEPRRQSRAPAMANLEKERQAHA